VREHDEDQNAVPKHGGSLENLLGLRRSLALKRP